MVVKNLAQKKSGSCELGSFDFSRSSIDWNEFTPQVYSRFLRSDSLYFRAVIRAFFSGSQHPLGDVEQVPLALAVGILTGK